MRFDQTWTASRYDPEHKTAQDSFRAEVPGNVQYDYAVSHGFGDFFFADRVKLFKDTEDFRWSYSTELQYAVQADESLWFVAEGIDYAFDILLDGKLLHSGEGMFHPVELDITAMARPGSLLQVIIHSHPKRADAPEGRFQADQSGKPPFCYGWDWNPRLLVSGLWRDAYIETRGKGYIRSCEPFYTLNETRDTAQVTFAADADAPVRYTLLDAAGHTVYQGTEPCFTLQDVTLWWCNGEGEPYLYTWIAETADCRKSGKLGFRTVRLVRNTGTENEPAAFPKSRYAAPVTVELNGRRIFAQGSNWVSPELFPGRVTEERYRELLTAAAEANMNILRVWGGCGIGKPAFYALCDELGLMVWQEFMLACCNYEGTEAYLKVLEQEAVSIIKSLRRHPSLILWCGGNELFNGWSGMDDQSAALRLLNKLCYEEDRSRPFLYTSPLCGMAHGGYYFRDMDDGREVFEVFASSANTAYTEFGVPAMAPVEQLKKIIPAEELFPVKATAAWTAHHGLEAWRDDSWVCTSVLEHYFGAQTCLEEMVERSAWLQALGYQAIYEEARRQWPHCSMAINWCYNEPWITAANNAVISYPNVKKEGYYAIRSSLRRVLASAKIARFEWRAGELFSAELWLLNSSNEAVCTTVTAVIEIDGTEYEQISWNTGAVEARTNKIGPQINFVLPADAVSQEMTLRLFAADGSADNRYRLKLIPLAEPAAKATLNM